jgi:hypothetical protein
VFQYIQVDSNDGSGAHCQALETLTTLRPFDTSGAHETRRYAGQILLITYISLTERIYVRCVQDGQPLWSCGHSSWLEIQRSWFDSRSYHIFWEVVGLKRGPLSLMSTTEELLERKISGSGLENREYGRRVPSCWPRGNLYQQKFALTSPTSGCSSAGIVRSWTQATKFVCFVCVQDTGTGCTGQTVRHALTCTSYILEAHFQSHM